ncbi:MAG: hypothetical protein ACLR0V_06410 [Roseburia hominis]
MPISDDEFIVPLLDTFGLKPFTGEETGTSVIIPYIDPSKLLEDIIPADAEIESEFEIILKRTGHQRLLIILNLLYNDGMHLKFIIAVYPSFVIKNGCTHL